MRVGKYRIQLRHIGTGPRRRPGYTRGNFRGDSGFWNIYLGGRLFLAIRPLPDDGSLVRKLVGQKENSKFFDLGFGRAQLKYRREEEACPWPGTDHYYGICKCPNKGPTHPRYSGREPEISPMRYMRDVHGDCKGCGVDEKTWCKDDCYYLDPIDWR